jgi:hypothetical protein
MADEAGYPLDGPISDRIRSGDIPPQWLEKSRFPVDDRPADWAVAGGSGYGLGDGATRRRSAPGAITHDHQLGEASMSREEHMGIVVAAGAAVGEAQELCSKLTEAIDSVAAIIENATGGANSNSEAGQNAASFAFGAQTGVAEVFGALEAAKAELERYVNGF